MGLGSASMSASLHAFMSAALNAKLKQGYGMTETLGGVIAMDKDDLSYGRCGAPVLNSMMKLKDFEEGGYRATDKPHPRGEIMIHSSGNAENYLLLDKVNAETFEYDYEGRKWLCTGDIGEIYEDGTLKIIDRKKDIIKLANGEYFCIGKVSILF